jgi:hypothetical protein
LNPMDEQRAAQIAANRTLQVRKTTGGALAGEIVRARDGQPGERRSSANLAAKKAARLLMDSL